MNVFNGIFALVNIILICGPTMAKASALDTLLVEKGQKLITPLIGDDFLESEKRKTKGLLSIDFDQDYFVDWMPKTNYDRNYTQGTAFSYSKYKLDESILFFPINLINRILYGKDMPTHLHTLPALIAVGVTAFTPRDIADSLNPVVGDRPFANVVFLTTAKNSFNSNLKIFTTSSFSYGIIGSNVANVFQSFAHKSLIKGRPTNIGWEYQISRGGHPAFLFSHSAIRSMFQLKDSNSDADKKKTFFQGLLGYRVNVGWYSGAAAVTTIRFGRFGKMSENLNIENALSVANSDPVERDLNDSPAKAKWDFDFFAFGTLIPRLTPYNSLLLGQPGVQSVYTLPKENYNPLILDSEYGLSFSFIQSREDLDIPIQRYDLLISINSRTSEIVSKDPTQENIFKRRHTWGRITLRVPLF